MPTSPLAEAAVVAPLDAAATPRTPPAVAVRPRAFEGHIHAMRGLAITGIVGAHALHALDWSARPVMARVIDTWCNQSSIIFFFIAGYLFRHLADGFEPLAFWRKKLATVVVPYLLLSIPALVLFTTVRQQDSVWPGFHELPVAEQVFWFLVTGKHLAPFWFVPTIVLFHLAAPLLLVMDRFPRAYLVIPPLALAAAWLGRDAFFGPFGKAFYLLPVWLLGMACARWRDRALALAYRLVPLLLVVAAAAFTAGVLVEAPPQGLQFGLKVATCGLLLVLFHRFERRVRGPFDLLAVTSFGVFFVHGYVIGAWKTAWPLLAPDRPLPAGDLLTFALAAGLALGLSLALVVGVQRLAGRHSRWLIGA